ncbi:MAG TPA: hypothetical protein VFZ65_15005 [Planctomycetota bacterium]|nr:hypothetical protein [Planctomycetota bacterium]
MLDELARRLALCLLPSCLFAQGPVPLSGTWRLGSITTETFSSTCVPAVPVHAVLEDGTVVFQPGGTATASITTSEVCPGAICSQGTDTGSTHYQVGPDGVLLLDDNPGAPAEDIGLGFVRSDASVLMLGRWNQDEDEPYLGVVVALSSGHSAASLADTYGFVRYVLRNDATSQTMRSDYGTFLFNGAGGFSETSVRHVVTWNGGGPSGATSFTGNDMYSVAADGTVTIASGGQGAVSRDREFVYWVRQSCPEVEMVLAVRLPLAGGTTYADGDWRVVSTEVDVGTSTLDSDWGTLTLTPTGGGAGTITPQLLRVSTVSTPSGTNTNQVSVANDSYALGTGGAVTLWTQGLQRQPMPAWIARDGSMLVGAPSMPGTMNLTTGGGIMLGFSRCALATPVGAGTPGAAGVTPLLFTIGGFPYAGNADFGFVVAAGLGGAPGLLLFSGAVLPAALPVFGFDLWVNPTLLAGSPLVVLSGPAGVAGVGAAGLPLALPSTPALAGTVLATQAIVLDAAAPQGLSASGALDVHIVR